MVFFGRAVVMLCCVSCAAQDSPRSWSAVNMALEHAARGGLTREDGPDPRFVRRRLAPGFAVGATPGEGVSCGGNRAASCAECARDHGDAWCHGDCVWHEGSCVAKESLKTPDNPYGCSEPQADGTRQCLTRTVSVHAWFDWPRDAGDVHWVFSAVKPLKSSTSTFFEALGHDYGYAGVQMVEKGDMHRIICSIWDQTSGGASITECGSDVQCTDFGGEGTGAKAQFEGWKMTVGQTYSFAISRQPQDNQVKHTCFVHAEEFESVHLGGWKHLATFLTGITDAGASFKNVYAFVEQWTRADSQDEREAEFGPVFYWSQNECWDEATHASFTSCPDNSAMVAQGLEDCTHTTFALSNGNHHVKIGTGGLDHDTCVNHAPFPTILLEGLPKSLEMFASTHALSGHVNCGGIGEDECVNCPHGHGAAWCNGECEWKEDTCVSADHCKAGAQTHVCRSEAPRPSDTCAYSE